MKIKNKILISFVIPGILLTVGGIFLHNQYIKNLILNQTYNNQDSQSLINDSILFSILLGISIIILIFISAKILSYSISHPIIELNNRSSIIKNGNLNYKTTISSNDEIGDLSTTINQMVVNLKKSKIDIEKKVKAQTDEIIKNRKNLENQNKALLNVLEDVSEEKNIISQERDKINTILKSIGDGVIVVDKNKKITFLNIVAEELTGWKLKQAKNENVDKIFNIFDEETNKMRKSPLDEAIEKGVIAKLTNHTVIKRKDGQIIPISDSAAPIRDSSKTIIGAVLVFRDVIDERISEQKVLFSKNKLEKINKTLDDKVDKRTKELKKAFEELKSLDAMKDEFLNISAHELKTPLTSIIALSELLLLNKQGPINNKQGQSLEIVNNEASRLLKIIKKILSITRIEAKKAMFDLQIVNLCSIAEKTIASLKTLADKENVKIICQKPTKPIFVKVDTERIQEVIYNLIDNALKFSPPKSNIFISGAMNKNNFIFSVKDQGPGISKEKQKDLFKKFSQLDTGFSRKQEGTGLGLYIAKIILENMNGKIWVESEKGKGAAFKFSLPIVKKLKNKKIKNAVILYT